MKKKKKKLNKTKSIVEFDEFEDLTKRLLNISKDDIEAIKQKEDLDKNLAKENPRAVKSKP